MIFRIEKAKLSNRAADNYLYPSKGLTGGTTSALRDSYGCLKPTGTRETGGLNFRHGPKGKAPHCFYVAAAKLNPR
jgi:hypothetical protein